MTRKHYKQSKRGSPKHVQLTEWLQSSEAWSTMKPGPRAAYVELKRRFNGQNNGHIGFSCRCAAEALNVTKNTACRYLAELELRGFIQSEDKGHLGPEGKGIASKWSLDEVPTQDGRPARKRFMSWRGKTEPRIKN